MLKKFVQLALVAIVFLSTSQAKMTPVDRVLASQKIHRLNSQTQMKNVLALAVPKHQRKFLVINELTDDNDDLPGPDELDLQVAFTRPRIANKKKSFDNDEELSDYIMVRLAVAREKAMKKYQETWA